jgi:hypothetical protein
MGASLPTRIKSCFSAMETSQFVINWEGYDYHVLGCSGNIVCQFLEAWRECEFCIVLWRSVETSGYNSQKRPGQLARGVLLHHDDNARPHAAQTTQERIRELLWGVVEHLHYSLDLAPSDFYLFGPLKNTWVVNVSLMTKRLKRRCESGWDNSQKTSVLRVSTHC